jgi:serine/threonine protein kinase
MADAILPEGLFADRYRIERVVGRGGMATVYAAEDIKHHRELVVIRVMFRYRSLGRQELTCQPKWAPFEPTSKSPTPFSRSTAA